MRALAMTGTVTTDLMPSIRAGSLIRATPPSRRMSAGTRSSAITATAPASSAILACSGVTTSMITPPRSISASPRLTRAVPVVRSVMVPGYRATSSGTEGLLLLRLGSGGRRGGRGSHGGHRHGRRRHVDRAAHREQVDPRAARPQRDRVARGVDVLRRLGLVGPHPAPGAHHAVGEDPGVALAHGLGLG